MSETIITADDLSLYHYGAEGRNWWEFEHGGETVAIAQKSRLYSGYAISWPNGACDYHTQPTIPAVAARVAEHLTKELQKLLPDTTPAGNRSRLSPLAA